MGSLWEKVSKSIQSASHASATVWKIPIGQPMQSILLRVIILIVAGLAAKTGVEERAMLYTKREWKKVSMRYFQES